MTSPYGKMWTEKMMNAVVGQGQMHQLSTYCPIRSTHFCLIILQEEMYQIGKLKPIIINMHFNRDNRYEVNARLRF